MTTTLMEGGKEVNPYQSHANGDAWGVNCSSKCSLQTLMDNICVLQKCVQYWPASVGDVLTQDSSRIGGELKIMMKSSESQTHWQHRVFTVEEITQEQVCLKL